MRVGVVTSLRSPDQGGGFTAQDCILDAIRAAQGPHQFVYLNAQPTYGQASSGRAGSGGISSKVKAAVKDVTPPFLWNFLRSVRQTIRTPTSPVHAAGMAPAPYVLS